MTSHTPIEYFTEDTKDDGLRAKSQTWRAEHNGNQYGVCIVTALDDVKGAPIPDAAAARMLAADRLALERNAEATMAIVWNVRPEVLDAANRYHDGYCMNLMLGRLLEKATLADVLELVRLTDLVGNEGVLNLYARDAVLTSDQQALRMLRHGEPEAEFKAKHGIAT
jgi:hypothetical protein